MLHREAGRRVGEPSFVTYRRELPASRTARFGTTCRSKPGRSPTSPAHCGGAPSKACPRQGSRWLYRVQGTCTSATSPPGRRRRRGDFALDAGTGRGHRCARIFDHRPKGGTAWGRCCSLFLGFDDPPHSTRQGSARDGMQVGEVGAGCPAGRRAGGAHVAFAVPAAGGWCGCGPWGLLASSEAPRSRPGRLPSARVKRPVPRRVHPPLLRLPPGRPAPAFPPAQLPGLRP